MGLGIHSDSWYTVRNHHYSKFSDNIITGLMIYTVEIQQTEVHTSTEFSKIVKFYFIVSFLLNIILILRFIMKPYSEADFQKKLK